MRAVRTPHVRPDCRYRDLAFRRTSMLNHNGWCRAAIALFALMWLFASPTADAGPFKDFFRKVRHAFTEKPTRSSGSHRTAHRSRTEQTRDTTRQQTTVNRPPNEGNTRSARRATVHRGRKTDLPYGVPVPGRAGFVTSPF